MNCSCRLILMILTTNILSLNLFAKDTLRIKTSFGIAPVGHTYHVEGEKSALLNPSLYMQLAASARFFDLIDIGAGLGMTSYDPKDTQTSKNGLAFDLVWILRTHFNPTKNKKFEVQPFVEIGKQIPFFAQLLYSSFFISPGVGIQYKFFRSFALNADLLYTIQVGTYKFTDFHKSTESFKNPQQLVLRIGISMHPLWFIYKE